MGVPLPTKSYLNHAMDNCTIQDIWGLKGYAQFWGRTRIKFRGYLINNCNINRDVTVIMKPVSVLGRQKSSFLLQSYLKNASRLTLYLIYDCMTFNFPRYMHTCIMHLHINESAVIYVSIYNAKNKRPCVHAYLDMTLPSFSLWPVQYKNQSRVYFIDFCAYE